VLERGSKKEKVKKEKVKKNEKVKKSCNEFLVFKLKV